jgi:hypothetical protein
MLFSSVINGEDARLAMPNLRWKGILIVKISGERGVRVFRKAWR